MCFISKGNSVFMGATGDFIYHVFRKASWHIAKTFCTSLSMSVLEAWFDELCCIDVKFYNEEISREKK